MPNKSGQKPRIPLVADRTSDSIWAVLTILSLPIAAMAFSAMEFNPIAAFLLAACVTFAIIVIETLVRGKIWIFQERFKDTFSHPDTPFRILIVTGGILLILQTLLIIQIFMNPDIDHFMLNVILRKQCDQQQGILTDRICPMFRTVRVSDSYALRHSLETEAAQHLIPTATLGTCSIVPLNGWPKPEASVNVEFFAYCIPWSDRGEEDMANAKAAVVQAVFDVKDDGFYAARTWSENSDGPTCDKMLQDRRLIEGIKQDLLRRKDALLRAGQ